MADPFSSQGASISGPAFNAAAVTPHDDNDLATVARALYVGGEGDVAVITKGGNAVTFVGVLAGSILPVSVSRVKDTGTDATNIVALW